MGFLLLSGCTSDIEQFYDSKLSLDGPVDWWHQLQGGPIADERPPPPGITDPYPNFSVVPPKPTPTDPATRAGLAAQLAAQRDQARLLAAQDPVVFPQSAKTAAASAAPAQAPATPSATASAPAATPANNDVSTMTLDASNASPPTQAAATPPPAANDPAAPAAFRAASSATGSVVSGPVVSGPIPALPTAAPALPVLPGLPTADPAPVVARPRARMAFTFAPGSAALPASAEDALRALAARAAGGPIAITAGGDARSNAPEAQGEALPLALRRTGAMTATLIGAGVASSAIRAEAIAPGREASARLVD